jgi:molybdenum cofactor cytidylyltransferase
MMPKICVVIMAAGASRRMGQRKLTLPIKGISALRYFLQGFPYSFFSQVNLVLSDTELLSESEGFPLNRILIAPNSTKHLTVQKGTEACKYSDGILYMVADQPLLKMETLMKLKSAFQQDPSRIVIPICEGKPRNPVIFPKKTYPELLNITGDRGGRDVIDSHPELKVFVEIEDANQFIDLDTPDDYQRVLDLINVE